MVMVDIKKYREFSKSLNEGKEKDISPGVQDQLPSDKKKHKSYCNIWYSMR